jgi:hypothetical protein
MMLDHLQTLLSRLKLMLLSFQGEVLQSSKDESRRIQMMNNDKEREESYPSIDLCFKKEPESCLLNISHIFSLLFLSLSIVESVMLLKQTPNSQQNSSTLASLSRISAFTPNSTEKASVNSVLFPINRPPLDAPR